MNAFSPVALDISYVMASIPFWEIVIKSTLALALTAIACECLVRQSAALRHRIWVFGLAASLLIPLLAFLSPRYALAVLPAPSPNRGVVAMPDAGDSSQFTALDPARRPPGMANESFARTAPHSQALLASDVKDSVAGQSDRALPGSWEWISRSLRLANIETLLVLCSGLGTIVGAGLFLIGVARHSLWLQRLRTIDDPDWLDSVSRAGRTLGLNRLIATLESHEACVPAVVGALTPCLVVPANWRSWSSEHRHCILLHELAHVQRRDVAAQLLGRLALLIFWFNPLAWYAVGRLRAERELASDDCVLLAGQKPSDYAEQLLYTLQCYRPHCLAIGVGMAHSARLDRRVRAILDPKRRRQPIGPRTRILLPCLALFFCLVMGAITLQSRASNAFDDSISFVPAAKAAPVWKEHVAIEFPGALPVSLQFSADGKTLLAGDTNGEIMALKFPSEQPTYRWKTKVEGAHAAVAFSADQKQVYATTKHGMRILDSALGKELGQIEVQNSSPIALGVFPDKAIAEGVTGSQVVFGNPHGYFIKSWVQGKLPESIGTIETSTLAKAEKPTDETAVPLAVDPGGRSAIMTGPIDSTGQIAGTKGKNVLWAYVCGDYDKGSPGNRVMIGHASTVVCAAWAKSGHVAVTGDASGRVIRWDAATMKEIERVELGGRVAALAISDDGTRTAAYVMGELGEVFVWETAKASDQPNPDDKSPGEKENKEKKEKKPTKIHTEFGSFRGATAFAQLSFAPDGKQLAGCAGDKAWLNNLGRLMGKVRVWELAAEPRAQLPPKPIFTKPLPKGTPTNFALLDNQSVFMLSAKSGAINLRRISDGEILAGIGLGKFSIGQMQRSADRRWLAIAQHELTNNQGVGVPPETFDVVVYESLFEKIHEKIPGCSRLLGMASGGKAVALVKDKRVELWDPATAKRLKSAPFAFTRIDAARFSPRGDLLALCDGNDLVLWQWEKNTHERISLGRSVIALEFSPDGQFLAEGPASGETIAIRDLKTRKIVQAVANETKSPMKVECLDYVQGGRVLIAGASSISEKEKNSSYKIHLWDAENGGLVHQLPISGRLRSFEISPNGLYLLATTEDGENVKLNGWRLDGASPIKEENSAPPAGASPR